MKRPCSCIRLSIAGWQMAGFGHLCFRETPDLGFGVHPGQTVNSSQDHALAEPVQDRV